MLIYTVKPGEKLEQIASEFQVTPASIIAVNGLPNPFRLLTGQSLIIPTAEPVIQKTKVSVNGYIYFLGEKGASIVHETAPLLTSVTPFSYIIKENGYLRAIDDESVIAETLANGIIPIMCVTNFSATMRGENLANVVLNNEETLQILMNSILFTMKNKGYQGLNLDFESILPEDRERYNAFLAYAADVMHEEGYFITTAVAPKVGPNQRGLLYEAIDYPVHGQLMDYVILMTYEWGYRLGPPQAISPIDQIRKVLDYAITVIPREKIYFGFQIYARDWKLPHVQGREAETISCQEALERAVAYNAVIQYDEVAESPYFRYHDEQGREHEVWFEDARSAQAKFDTVKEYGLEGISYWVLGYPFPQNWTLLNENFEINRGTSGTL